jgi:alpha-ketoglutarate-dependent taurine dioxygenase
MKNPAQNNQFLADESTYLEWRKIRLRSCPHGAENLIVEINSLANLTDIEIQAITRVCRRTNMAIYRCRDKFADREAVRAFASSIGLQRIDHHLCANADGVSELTVASNGVRKGYVPYSNRSLSWHTDGYYNDKARQISAVVLHCVHSAKTGGENALLDPEVAYIRLRDEDPRFITALEHPKCMTIPANMGAEGEIRAEVCGPVFSCNASGDLHMRYSARKKNIRWRDDDLTRAAREFLSEVLSDKNDLVFRYRLRPGEGLVSNNVLHNRTTFTDGPGHQRLLYRARFFNRIKTD